MIVFSSLQIRRGSRVLLNNATATINAGQKVGLVGKNGCGKSTLLALLKAELTAEAGSVTLPGHWSLAWVNQETPALDKPAIEYVIDGDREYRLLEQQLEIAIQNNAGNDIATLHASLDTIQAWSIQARAATLMHGLGFRTEQAMLPVRSFSGGWRMRLNLAQALICRSDLLLLDEPTNHLDLDAVIWLERWLKNYAGTLILISHDRDFLDPTVNKILHIDQENLSEYTGNYSSFEQQRAAKFAQQQSLFQSQQHKIAHLQHYIARFRAKATKAKQAQSRIKMLERMEKIAPAHIDNPFSFEFFEPDALPVPLLKIEAVSAGYDQQVILQWINLNLVPGSRIGLIGRNGAGKSTLIKLLAGQSAPISGKITFSKGLNIGYFAQHQLELLCAEASPMQHLQRLAPKLPEQQLRDFLGRFGFQGEAVNGHISQFSGGEKARLVLALIVWQKPNLLLLDEPTNHLDLDMRQALTEALMGFSGALILVSHDRHLLRSSTDEFYLVDEGSVQRFDGCLDDYQHWLQEKQKELTISAKTSQNSDANHGAQARKAQKRQAAELRLQSQPLRREIAKLERQIDEWQAKFASDEQQLGDSSLYLVENKLRLTQVLQQQAEHRKKLDQCEAAWLAAQQRLDDLLSEY